MDVHVDRRFGEPGTTLAAIGERELLGRLEALARRVSTGLVVGPGDDAAIWRVPPGRDLVISQDCLVEGVDFRREWIRPHQLGRRALAVALSDLAAMGARPALCSATLCAPGDTLVEDVLALQGGLAAAAAESGCALAGGDLSDTAGPLVVDLCVAGTVAPGRALRRDSGRPGDALVVTGVLGRAAAGLRLLGDPELAAAAPPGVGRRWVRAQLEPAARLAEGQALVAAGVSCGGDLSDGLVVEARRIAERSRCAAELWLSSIPVDGSLARVFPSCWPDLALAGGEELELLAAVDPARLGPLSAGWPARLGPLAVVGRLHDGSGVTLLEARGGPDRALPAALPGHWS